MRSLLALLLTALLLAPAGAYAQAETEEPERAETEEDAGTEDAEAAVETDEAASAEGTAIEGGGYEPDQRGAEGGGQYEPDQRGAEGGGQYEPDQRGAEGGSDEADAEPPEPTEALGGAAREEAAYIDGDGFLGLDLQLWLGGGVVGLDAIDGDNLVRSSQRGGASPSFGFVGALRVGPVSVGPRVGVTVDPSFVMASFGGDVQAVLTGDRLAPFVRASLSYVFLTDLDDALPSQPDATIGGVLAEIGVGARFRFAGPFVLGAELSGGYLHLERDAVSACEAPCSDGDLDLAVPGSANGLTFRVHLWGGVSF